TPGRRLDRARHARLRGRRPLAFAARGRARSRGRAAEARVAGVSRGASAPASLVIRPPRLAQEMESTIGKRRAATPRAWAIAAVLLRSDSCQGGHRVRAQQ